MALPPHWTLVLVYAASAFQVGSPLRTLPWSNTTALPAPHSRQPSIAHSLSNSSLSSSSSSTSSGSSSSSSSRSSSSGGSVSETNLSSSDIAQRLSQAHFEFTLKLYRALARVGDPSANIAFSPLLVSTLLTPTLLSAKDYAHVLLNNLPKTHSSSSSSSSSSFSSSSSPSASFLPSHSSSSLLSSSPSLSHSPSSSLLSSFDSLGTNEEEGERGRKENEEGTVIHPGSKVQKVLSISQQIKKVLNFNDLSGSAVEAWHKATVASLQDKYYKGLLQAPRGFLLMQKGPRTSPSSKELDRVLRKWFGHTFRKVQEPMHPSSLVKEVNRWAENETNYKIKNFLHENYLREKQVIILSPAFIQSLWLNNFDPNETFQKGLFYRTSGDRFEIPMMINRLELPLGYSETLEARVLELPLQMRRASIFILLPDHLDQSLSNLEANVTSENVRSLLATLKTEVVNLRIPKFYIDTTLSLTKALKVLGVKDLFRDGSQSAKVKTDFTLDDFIHRIRFEVQEGIEDDKTTPTSFSSATSFTSAIESRVGGKIGRFGEKYFEVDHPFIFFLWDYIASTIICMGRVMDPRRIQSRRQATSPRSTLTRVKKSTVSNGISPLDNSLHFGLARSELNSIFFKHLHYRTSSKRFSNKVM